VTENNTTRFAVQSNSDWRRRASNHLKNIADLLMERGEQGMCVQGSYLYDHPELYGRSPRSRVSDLNKLHGWDVGSKTGEHGCACYWVRRDGDGRTYPTQRFDEPPNAPRPQLVKRPEAPWNERQRATGLPLFDLAARP
jgi:hypothetical protein